MWHAAGLIGNRPIHMAYKLARLPSQLQQPSLLAETHQVAKAAEEGEQKEQLGW